MIDDSARSRSLGGAVWRILGSGAAFLGVLALVGAAYLMVWPIPIAPRGWAPTPIDAAASRFAGDRRLDRLESILADAPGPEALAPGPGGRLYTGLADGRIVRFDPTHDEAGFETVAETGGRPYGLRVADDGSILVADGRRGILSVHPNGAVEVVVDELNGAPIRFADDVIVAPDGLVWFTVASTRFGPDQLAEEFAELGPNGLLAWYDPATGRADIAIADLRFANGLALHPDGESLLVTETAGFRITRYWYAGPKRGVADIFADGLPGWPDNIVWDAVRSRFWVAFPNARGPVIDDWARSGWLRAVEWRLQQLPGWPERKAPPSIGFVLAFDAEGAVVDGLGASDGRAANITSATPLQGALYLGSGRRSGVRRVSLEGGA
jgi:sugar lactone lactonase YvrE